MSRRTIGRPRDLIRLGYLGSLGERPQNVLTRVMQRENMMRRRRKRRNANAPGSSTSAAPEPSTTGTVPGPIVPEPSTAERTTEPTAPAPVIEDTGYSDDDTDMEEPVMLNEWTENGQQESEKEEEEEEDADDVPLPVEGPENVRLALERAMEEMALNDSTEQEAEDILPTTTHDTNDVVSPQFDPTEEVDQFLLGMALFADQASLSRSMWESLVELLNTVENLQQLKKLPKSLATVKTARFKAVKILPVRKKELPVVNAKMPTLSHRERQEAIKLTKPMFYIDPVATLLCHLTQNFKQTNHIGLAEFVQHPKEMWQTHAWASSVRTSSGDLGYYADSDERIIPTDIVEYVCRAQAKDCFCASSGNHLGRIIEIGTKDKVRGVNVQPILTADSPIVKNSNLHPLERGELAPVEGKWLFRRETELRRTDATIIWNMEEQPPAGESPYIRRIYRKAMNGIHELVPLGQSKMLRADLELRAFGGREQLLRMMCPKGRRVICVPLMLFIDGFGLYRNMHRSLIGIYAIMATLSSSRRRRKESIYALAFGPHGANFPDVIGAIAPELAALDGGVDVCSNGEEIRIVSYPICFLGDMPQQNQNCGIAHPTGRISCRFCLVSQEERGNLAFDLIKNKRYLDETKNKRRAIEQARTLKGKEALRRSSGFATEESPLYQISRAMDITCDMPSDPCHSELAGLTKIAVTVLMDEVFTPAGRTEFGKVLRSFPMPQGWQRLQSPEHHLEKYQIQEFARLGTIMPILFRLHLKPHWIQLRVREALPFFFNGALDRSGDRCQAEELLTKALQKMATANATLISWTDKSSDAQYVDKVVREGREALQVLLRSVAMSINTSNAMTGSQYSTQALTQIHTPGQGRRSKKTEELMRMMKRPNMHIGLHYCNESS